MGTDGLPSSASINRAFMVIFVVVCNKIRPWRLMWKFVIHLWSEQGLIKWSWIKYRPLSMAKTNPPRAFFLGREARLAGTLGWGQEWWSWNWPRQTDCCAYHSWFHNTGVCSVWIMQTKSHGHGTQKCLSCNKGKYDGWQVILGPKVPIPSQKSHSFSRDLQNVNFTAVFEKESLRTRWPD